MCKDRVIKYGDIYYVNLNSFGSVQKGIRPCVVISNNIGNYHSNIVIVVPLTTKIEKQKNMPTHLLITPSERNGLKHDSVITTEQIITVDKQFLINKIGTVDNEILNDLNNSVMISVSPTLS